MVELNTKSAVKFATVVIIMRDKRGSVDFSTSLCDEHAKQDPLVQRFGYGTHAGADRGWIEIRPVGRLSQHAECIECLLNED